MKRSGYEGRGIPPDRHGPPLKQQWYGSGGPPMMQDPGPPPMHHHMQHPQNSTGLGGPPHHPMMGMHPPPQQQIGQREGFPPESFHDKAATAAAHQEALMELAKENLILKRQLHDANNEVRGSQA